MIIDTVELFLDQYNLLLPKNNIIVAFSGGYDSLCLLDIMKQLSIKHDLNLYAVHLNHNWRGEESDNEEINCRNYCQDINFYSEKLSEDIPHTETAARDARYEFFKRCAEKFNSHIVLTAHNANDNAETVLYRIAKGTGFPGLEGILEHRDIYYRPLLSIYRKEIEQYCKEKNLNPNNDSSNFDTCYARNKIRYEILPQLEEISPNIIEKINKLANNTREINNLLEKELKLLEKYSADEFLNLHNIYQTIVVHKFLREKHLNYDRKKIEDIVSFINNSKNSKSGKTYSLTNNLWLFASSKEIKTIKKENFQLPEIDILSESEYIIGEYIFSIQKCEKLPEKFPKDNEFFAYVSLNEVNFTLRQRKNGDIIQPLGLNGTQKLKKYLNEKKIPNHEKEKLIFLCKGNEILWAPGLGISDKIKVVTVPTHVIRLEKR